jgi:hypothetical protein
VLDAGNPAAPGSGGSACAALDQRGTTRPQGAACDAGAVERTAGDPGTTSTSTTIVTTTSTSTSSTTLPVACLSEVEFVETRLTIENLGAPLGDERIDFRGRIPFAKRQPVRKFKFPKAGAQIQIVDAGAGNVPLFDLTLAGGAAVPPGKRGKRGACAAGDGWKKNAYANESGAFPPACAAGSANGLRSLTFTDGRKRGGGLLVEFIAAGASVPRPQSTPRIAVIPGTSAAFDTAPSSCGSLAFHPLSCAFDGTSTVLTCFSIPPPPE